MQIFNMSVTYLQSIKRIYWKLLEKLISQIMQYLRHVKCNSSPMLLTEKGTVFHKTDFKKKFTDFWKNAIVLKGFL